MSEKQGGASVVDQEDGAVREGRPVDAVGLRIEAALHQQRWLDLPRSVWRALMLTWTASRRGFVVAAILQILGALVITALVPIGQQALTALTATVPQADQIGTVLPVVVLLAVVTAVGSASATLQQQQQRLLSEQVSKVTWSRVLDVSGYLDLERFESSTYYDQLERIKVNALYRPMTVTMAAFGLIGSAAGTVGLLIVLTMIDPLLVPVLLLAGIPALLLSRRASRLEFTYAASVTPAVRAREYLRGVLTGRDEAKEVRAFGAQRELRIRHDVASERCLTLLGRHIRERQVYALASVAATALTLIAALGLLVWLLAAGRVTLADAGAAALGIRLLSGRLDQLFGSVGTIVESSIFLDDLDAFAALETAREPGGPGRGLPLRHHVQVQGVTYTYPGSRLPAVRDVTLRIGAGEVVAIVGENGSGKSTLAKLIAGLYQPHTGAIRWDGIDSTEIDPADLRRSIAVVFQDFVRYQLSALENIGLGDPQNWLDEERARSAAVRAGAHGFLRDLPDSYRTVLSKEFDDGAELSVGQWQRVAFARALRRDAPLIILDEPSAALDPRAEQALFADVRATLAGRSAVLISHRYSTVRAADRIYVMRDGRIVEAGSHESLMSEDGLYAELFTLQAKAYL